jgi:hypothetical protein
MPKKKKPNHSTIKQHHQKGKTLVPPLANLPNLTPASWMDERLPEMLWAVLIVAQLPQPRALAIFRRVAEYFYQFRNEKDAPSDVRHSGLSKMKPEVLEGFLQTLLSADDCTEFLRPLLLFHDLPARAAWEKALDVTPLNEDWKTLMHAVALTLDHQSQESTDCRWIRVVCVLFAGKLVLQSKAQADEYLNYPNVDLRKVRPTIRATEISLTAFSKTDDVEEWAGKFWSQCLSDTPCFPVSLEIPNVPEVATTPGRVQEVYDLLVGHCDKTRTTTTVDPKHDTTFGTGLYCLSILQELLRIGASQSITARPALRTIVDCLISLAYLAKKDAAALWKSYRVFGAGQAKLSYLKLEEMEETLSHADVDSLKRVANEDLWEEYLPIELGHWEKSNTRRMSEDAGVKDFYDRFYIWPSTFSHGHWGALRDSVFDTCGNPAHRLHRIPRDSSRTLRDVLPDACLCVDKLLEVISKCYPDFPHKVTVKMKQA